MLVQTADLQASPKSQGKERTSIVLVARRKKSWKGLLWQFFCFCLVGGLNTIVDLLLLNGLLWIWPTQDTMQLLVYNSCAYAFGAVNSFLLNKYWTFQKRQQTTYKEVFRFALTTLCGIICNDTILWLVGTALHPTMINATLWTNTSKVLAICGTFLISYLGMHLWVFAHHSAEEKIEESAQ